MIEKNQMGGVSFKRLRWWYVPLLFLPIAIGTFIHWLTKPLPPPVVSLSLKGFKVYPTNTYAVMCLSNLGPTIIYFDSRYWEATFISGKAMTTNYGQGFSTIPSLVLQNSNEVFYVEVPKGSKSWRVEAGFSYYRHHHWRFELADWLIRKRVTSQIVWKPLGYFDPEWTRLLEPEELGGSAATGWLTNVPTAKDPK
ncbi:hypothetical protein GC207_14000 [bacterium]|nr:hypothetical protein [bacterium]